MYFLSCATDTNYIALNSTGQLHHKEQEIRGLKETIADLMAVMPMASYPAATSSGNSVATPRYSVNFCTPRQQQGEDGVQPPVVVAKPMVGVSPLVQQQQQPPPPQPPQQQSNPSTPPPGAQSQGTSPAKASVLDPNAAVYRPKSN